MGSAADAAISGSICGLPKSIPAAESKGCPVAGSIVAGSVPQLSQRFDPRGSGTSPDQPGAGSNHHRQNPARQPGTVRHRPGCGCCGGAEHWLQRNRPA